MCIKTINTDRTNEIIKQYTFLYQQSLYSINSIPTVKLISEENKLQDSLITHKPGINTVKYSSKHIIK